MRLRSMARWGRMISCAPGGNRGRAAICKRRQAGYQPAAGCQPAPPQNGILRLNSSANSRYDGGIMRKTAVCLLFALSVWAVPPAQKNDEAYTAKILQYTTEKYFLTELVDHLPASDTVPTPEKVLGYAIGTPNKLTYTKDIHRYMRELEKASKRVKTFVIGPPKRAAKSCSWPSPTRP